MSIPSIHSVGRAASYSADLPAATNPKPSSSGTDQTIDPVTQEPVPPRFPWLSRLSLQLEAAARHKALFSPAPALGDHVDQSV